MEAGCIAVAPAALPVPGAHGLHRVSASLLDNLAADQGRVIIAAIENGTCLGPLSGASARSAPGAAGGGFLKPVAPSKGSYAVLCQVVGVQRLGEGGMVRLRAEERVAVQVRFNDSNKHATKYVTGFWQCGVSGSAFLQIARCVSATSSWF